MEELILKFKNAHDFTKVLIVALVLVILAAVIGFVLLKLQNKSQVVNLIPNSTSTTEVIRASTTINTSTSLALLTASSPSASSGQFETDVSNWKTYRNEKYGFEFKYPQSWALQQGIINSNLWITVLDENSGSSFDVDTYPNSGKLTLAQWLSKDKELSEIVNTRIIIVGGMPAQRLKLTNTIGNVRGEAYVANFLSPDNKYFYRATSILKENDSQYFDNILGTLKFFEPIAK